MALHQSRHCVATGTSSRDWAKLSWSGKIWTKEDALLILQAAGDGSIPRVTCNLDDAELITSGSVFVGSTDADPWDDGLSWPTSFISSGFVCYVGDDGLIKKVCVTYVQWPLDASL